MEEESVPLKLSKGVSTMTLGDDKTKVCHHHEICPYSIAALVDTLMKFMTFRLANFGK
jgi:hypothetical protein